MKLFFSKADRLRLLGFDDWCFTLLAIFPLAALANVLFGGAAPGLDVRDGLTCYGIAVGFTSLYWVVSRFWMISFRNWFPTEAQTVRRILLTVPVLLCNVIAVSLLTQPLIRLAGVREIVAEPPIIYKVVMSFTLVIMVLAVYEGIFFFTKYRQARLDRERLAKENMQSQLGVLKQQMNPHFLFNSLNTLVNVIPEDSRKATLFTQRLAAVYRRILEWRHKEVIFLSEEVAALQDYVFLMQTRFEDKLRVCWHWQQGARTQVQCEGEGAGVSLPPELGHRRVVPLSLQLLVENAIKHNVVSAEHPLRIDITVGHDRVVVRNARAPRAGRTLDSTGWGHENLRARYAMVCDQPLTIEANDTFYRVTVPLLGHAAARVAV